MSIDFGREICGDLNVAEKREWLVTNGLGSYASGTVAGLVTRGYHGLLIAARKPPLERFLLLAKLEETAHYDGQSYALATNRWVSGAIDPHGYRYIERFYLEGTMPVWNFALGDALLEKRIWMQPDANTTYVRYTLLRATFPLTLSIRALVNYRDYGGSTQAGNWHMDVVPIEHGVRVTAFSGATPLNLFVDRGEASPAHEWYIGFDLAMGHERGESKHDDNLYAANFQATLQQGDALTFVASTESHPDRDGTAMLDARRAYEQEVIARWQTAYPTEAQKAPDWINHLVLAADQFVVKRPVEDNPDGKTIIAGYHWFSDWGRDTMISLPGLTLATGRPEVAQFVLRTFSKFVNQGILPNLFPDDGSSPLYNTVDATLWYFEAIRHYYLATGDNDLLRDLFPILVDIIDWHRRGTHFNIKLEADGLISAGDHGVQLTWMDAMCNGIVFTPRRGKPIEVNALWYNALRTLSQFAQKLGEPHEQYDAMAEVTRQGFRRFWNETTGYCFDVLDGPDGNDASLRPNQIFAVSLPESPLTSTQQRAVVEICARFLLTSYGLRSLVPSDPKYIGHYGGERCTRDAAYHQGTVWGWLLGPFVLAHMRVFNDVALARQFLQPMSHHLHTAGLGTISEIFAGDAPMRPVGCIAQAWSVAETLRAWLETSKPYAKNQLQDAQRARADHQ
jgi:predicted glycogen debranching enzyme